MCASERKWKAAHEAIKSQFKVTQLLSDHSSKEKKLIYPMVLESPLYFNAFRSSRTSEMTNLMVQASLLSQRLCSLNLFASHLFLKGSLCCVTRKSCGAEPFDWNCRSAWFPFLSAASYF